MRNTWSSDHAFAAGLDSLSATELHGALQSQLGLNLPATLAFDYPTPAAIAALASSLLADARLHAAGPGGATPSSLAAVSTAARHPEASAPVVVNCFASMSAEPASAGGTASRDLQLRDAVSLVPCERWDANAEHSQARCPITSLTAMTALVYSLHSTQCETKPVAPDQVATPRFAAFINSPFAFDMTAFGLSASEALLTDPQHRLLLESINEALPSASVPRGAHRRQTDHLVGVFVGIASPDYASMAQAHSGIGPYGATGGQ